MGRYRWRAFVEADVGQQLLIQGLLAPIGAQQVIHGLLALIQETHEGVREVLDVAADLVELFRNAGLFELQGRARTFAGGL